MFTGIITHVVPIKKTRKTNDGLVMTFARPSDWNDLRTGESVATNGACLTVAAVRGHEYDCLVTPETLARTSFGASLPQKVNLERPLTMQDRFGGHFVQGHVDSTGTVVAVGQSDGYRLGVRFDPDNQGLVVYKGSITVDGVSLTVSDAKSDCFEVALVPHTLKSTTLGSLKAGDVVNLEFDVIGKYVRSNMKARENHATG